MLLSRAISMDSSTAGARLPKKCSVLSTGPIRLSGTGRWSAGVLPNYLRRLTRSNGGSCSCCKWPPAVGSCACARFEAARLQVCLPRSALPPQASLALRRVLREKLSVFWQPSFGAPAAHALENGYKRRESVGDG